ncbi:hypothetical protein ABPG72_017709 [Tetrahymena utriculariae]
MQSNTLVILLAVALLSTTSYLVFQRQTSDLSDIKDILPPYTNIQTRIQNTNPLFLIQYNGFGKVYYKVLYQNGEQNVLQQTQCLANGMTAQLKVTNLNQILAVEDYSCPYVPPCPGCGPNIKL